MQEIKGPPYYDIEYATAHVEAIIVRAKATIGEILDGTTPRNGHLAGSPHTLAKSKAHKLRRTATPDRQGENTPATPATARLFPGISRRSRSKTALNARSPRHLISGHFA